MSFIIQLQEALSKYNLLNHVFYQYWNEGKLDREILKTYASQYFHHVEAFPRTLSAVHSNCLSPEDRKIILGNLIEEENSNPTHPELWLKFASSLEVSESQIRTTKILEKTQNLLDVFRTCSKFSYESGIGSLYAHEWQYSEIAKTKKEGLIKHYNITKEEDLEFFSVHSEIDVWHSEQLISVIERTSLAQHDEITKGAISSAKSLWGFLDGMNELITH